jgi:hypothetical protein
MSTKLSKVDVSKLILQAQSEALVRHLDDRCVGILGFRDDFPEKLGSGTCITLGGRFFIATAAHVIAPYTNDELFIIHSRTPGGTLTPILRRGARGGRLQDPEDVAFLELAPEHARSLGKNFVDASRLMPGISHLPEDNVLVYGYPEDNIDPAQLAERHFKVQPIGFLSPPMPLASVTGTSTALDARYHLVFEYPKIGNILSTGAALPELPAAWGISGGSVWAGGMREPGVWAPDKCRLIAIEYRWFEFEWARCTQIQHWLDLLRCDLPELKAHIDPILGCRWAWFFWWRKQHQR